MHTHTHTHTWSAAVRSPWRGKIAASRQCRVFVHLAQADLQKGVPPTGGVLQFRRFFLADNVRQRHRYAILTFLSTSFRSFITIFCYILPARIHSDSCSYMNMHCDRYGLLSVVLSCYAFVLLLMKLLMFVVMQCCVLVLLPLLVVILTAMIPV
jgi:hypothetical protein